MTTQGRSGGSRRRRVSGAGAAADAPAIENAFEPALEPAFEPAPAPAAAHPSSSGGTGSASAEILDDTIVAISGRGRGRTLGRSVPGAIAGTVLVVGLAFGAAMGPGGALGPASDRSNARNDTAAARNAVTGVEAGGTFGEYGATYPGDGDKDSDDHWGGPDSTAGPGGTDAGDGEAGEAGETDTPDGGEAGETAKPDLPDPTKKPAPDRTPKPTEKPDADPPVDHIALELAIKEYHPLIAWGSCEGLDFDYYKVVRSTDSTVTWPAGDNDELIGAVEAGGYRKAWDRNASHGRKLWYRVFCVRKGEDGYRVVRSSAPKGIEVPEEPAPPTPPDPISLGLEATVTDEGKVVLSWSACEVDGFAFYKVVKSTWNENPSYLPWTDGTEVIGVVSEMHATGWHDWAPDAGQTVYYRVQCLGYVGDHKVLLGQSAVVAVTTP